MNDDKPPDELRKELFDFVQHLRSAGATPAELVPRLRDIADSYEDHFKGSDAWDEAPVDKDVVLPGGSEK